MKIRPLTSHPLAQRGFTLIELLVVISIIAVLAGLLFPAMGAVRTSARKASAANDCMQIVNAVKNFYTDYGRYPVATTAAAVDFNSGNSTNAAVINELRMPTTFTTPVYNTRKIRYLEAKEAKAGTDPAATRSAVDTAGTWRDPWRNPYVILIDSGYNGEIALAKQTVGNIPTANETLQLGAAVGSHGPGASDSDKPPAPTKFTSPIGSWK